MDRQTRSELWLLIGMIVGITIAFAIFAEVQ
jgi:hypothetical protein